MAVTPGKDYALAKKTTWTFETGIGDATGILTPYSLCIFPHSTMAADSRKITDTDFTIGGKNPAVAIQELVDNPDTSPESLDEQLEKWSKQVEGPINEPMEKFKRVRIFTGFFRRSVVFSVKEKGMEFGATMIRPKKNEMPQFVEFVKALPDIKLELKESWF